LILGDQNGGSGWHVKTEHGADEMYYVDLPPDIGHVDMMLMDAPPVQGMANSSATDLARVYLDNIGYLVSNARGRFVNV
jgi:hypothetical protein